MPHLPSPREFQILRLRNEILPNEGWKQLVALQKLRIVYFEKRLTQLPSLENVRISFCFELESLPEGLAKLKTLNSLNVGGPEVLRSLPDSVGELESLKHLYTHKLKKLELAPDSLGQLKALNGSEIRYCEALVSLLQGLRYLSLLPGLWIIDCPLLRERCKRECVDWPKIFLPNIFVNYQRIQ